MHLSTVAKIARLQKDVVGKKVKCYTTALIVNYNGIKKTLNINNGHDGRDTSQSCNLISTKAANSYRSLYCLHVFMFANHKC